MDKKHKYNLGIIGNCSYLSYIDQRANVVWQCWPYFDSSFIFGNLISEKDGGEFSITPTSKFTSKQYYLNNSNILATEFECEDGRFRVIDFAPRFELFERFHKPLMLFRKIEVLEGTPMVKVICEPVGDYGKRKATASLRSNSINFEGLETKVRLTTNVSKNYILNKKSFALTQNHHMVLSYGSALEAPLERTFEEFFSRTLEYWQKWVRRTSIPNLYQNEVIRSALLLKIHQYEDTGAIIASGTTSLPEHPGHGRNWDYRYCWIRDSYFTLQALNSLSHFREAEGYSHWIQNIVQNTSIEFQPVYKIDGSDKITEVECDIEGYMGNKPVRVGNEAYKQVQYDVYGQMLLTLAPLYLDARVSESDATPNLTLLNDVLTHIERIIDKPDAGIWEFRGKMQRHAESQLFHWAGAHATKKIALKHGNDQLVKRSEKIIAHAAKNIELCYDSKQEAYGMSIENKLLNASEFLLVNMQYIQDEKKAREHIRALEKELRTHHDLIYRYRDHDDFGATHSAFLICGFWYAEALAAVDEVGRAQVVFENMLKFSNDLGIFSEDVDPETGSQWGNFSQTYSHVGLINAAFRIAQKIGKPIFL